MNPMQVAEQIKSLPDQILVQEMGKDPGSIPKYVLLAELQRRKGVRESGNSQMPPGAQTSVVEDTMAQGLGQVAPQRGFAGGGYIGRLVDYNDNAGWGAGNTIGLEELRRPTWDKLWEALKNANWMGKRPPAIPLWPSSWGNKKETPSAATPDKPIPEMFDFGPYAPQEDPNAKAIRDGAVKNAAANANAGASTGLGAALGMATEPVTSMGIAAALEYPDVPNLPELKPFDREQALKEWKAENPDLVGPLKDKYLDMLEKDKTSKDDMATMAMMRMGIGMMNTKSPTFLGGAGEGAAAALAGYENELRQNKLVDREIMKAQMDFAAKQMGYNADASRGALALREFERAENDAQRKAIAEKYNMSVAALERARKAQNDARELELKEKEINSRDRYYRGMVGAATTRAAGSGTGADKLPVAQVMAEYNKLKADPQFRNWDPVILIEEAKKRVAQAMGIAYTPANFDIDWGAKMGGGPSYDISGSQ